MANKTVTLSSVGDSDAVNLDWMSGKPVAVAVTGASSLTPYSIEYTLDDLLLTAASDVTWVVDPNVTALTSNSSGIYLYQQPLAGIRLASTASSGGTLTMWVNQGIGW